MQTLMRDCIDTSTETAMTTAMQIGNMHMRQAGPVVMRAEQPSTPSFRLSDVQVELLTHYAGGKFMALIDATSAQSFSTGLQGTGDKLLGFLVQECASLNEVGDALRMIDSVSGRLDHLYGEMEHAEVRRSLSSLRHRA